MTDPQEGYSSAHPSYPSVLPPPPSTHGLPQEQQQGEEATSQPDHPTPPDGSGPHKRGRGEERGGGGRGGRGGGEGSSVSMQHRDAWQRMNYLYQSDITLHIYIYIYEKEEG